MRRIKAVVGYAFEDINGNKLTLELGDASMHYRLKGSKIPFPIFGGTWFTGLRVNKMLESIEDTGYILRAKINYSNGKVDFYNEHKIVIKLY